MVEESFAWFLTQGVLGVCCVLLLTAVVYLHRENNRLRDRMLERALETLEKTINALNENSQTSKLLTEKIETVKRSE